MSQEQTVLKHLKETKSITGVEAAAIYKIRSLPRRIATLRTEGHDIKSSPKVDVTGQRYVRYEYTERVKAVESATYTVVGTHAHTYPLGTKVVMAKDDGTHLPLFQDEDGLLQYVRLTDVIKNVH